MTEPAQQAERANLNDGYDEIDRHKENGFNEAEIASLAENGVLVEKRRR